MTHCSTFNCSIPKLLAVDGRNCNSPEEPPPPPGLFVKSFSWMQASSNASVASAPAFSDPAILRTWLISASCVVVGFCPLIVTFAAPCPTPEVLLTFS